MPSLFKQASAKFKRNSTTSTRQSVKGVDHLKSKQVYDFVPELSFERCVVDTEEDIIRDAATTLIEFENIFSTWEIDPNARIEQRILGGKSSKRGSPTCRIVADIENLNAKAMHRFIQSERGMELLDNHGSILSMRQCEAGPYFLQDQDAFVQLEVLQNENVYGVKRDLVYLNIVDNENLTLTLVSTLYSDAPDASIYENVSHSRAVIAVEYRCIPLDDGKCKLVVTSFIDLGGSSNAQYNTKVNRSALLAIANRVVKFNKIEDPLRVEKPFVGW